MIASYRIFLCVLFWSWAAAALALQSYSPDQSTMVQSKLSKAKDKFEVSIVDTTTFRELNSYRSDAGEFSAVWSPDGRYVAITEEKSEEFSSMKVFCIRHGSATEIGMPEWISKKKIEDLVPDSVYSKVSFPFCRKIWAEEWESDNQLLVGVFGKGRVENDQGELQGYIELDHLVVLKVDQDKPASVAQHKKRQYKVRDRAD